MSHRFVGKGGPLSFPGLCIGVVSGFFGGLASVLLVDSVFSTGDRRPQAMLQIVGELLAIPTFMFGGTWAATKVAAGVQWHGPVVLNSFFAGLLIVFLPLAGIACWLLLRGIGRRANQLDLATGVVPKGGDSSG